jgi:hypothetical protein
MCCISFHSIESSCSQRNWVITNWAKPDNAEVQSEDLIHTQVEVKRKKKKKKQEARRSWHHFHVLLI